MKKKILLFVFITITVNVFSQNLVPNPGFEKYIQQPTADNQLKYLQYWKSANKGTPDFYTSDSVKFRSNPLKNTLTKNGHVGLVFRPENKASGLPEYYEYIYVPLQKSLEQNKTYIIKCDVYAVTETSFSTVFALINLDASFLKDSIYEKNTKLLNLPHIKLKNTWHLLDDTIWTTICGAYTAKGNEKYLLLGSFTKRENFQISKHLRDSGYDFDYLKEHNLRAYYYIDNVSVEELDSTNACEKIVAVKKPPLDLKTIKVGQAVKIENIYFETASAILLPASDTSLNSLVNQMKKNPNVKIEISGHTDNVGEASYNLKLSQDRAKAVMDYLVANGIKINRMTYKGYGSTKPIAPNTTTEGKALNRRVEFTILKK
jgi:OOP family OmpA-OmpF porin